jgi:hypothetical protein
MREVDWGALVESLGQSTHATVLAQQQIHDDLGIITPMARIRKHKDSVDVDLGEVSVSRVFVLVFRKYAERRNRRLPLHDIAGCDHILEAVAFGHVPTLFTVAAHDENRLVGLCHFSHGGVATDELARRYCHTELLAQIETALLFSLATALIAPKSESRLVERQGSSAYIGDKDVGHFDAVRVVAIEILHGLLRLRDHMPSFQKDAVDIKGKGIVGDNALYGG